MLVALALLRSLILGVLTPPYQSSDEHWHLDYARALSQGDLPVLGETPMDPAIIEHDRTVATRRGLGLYGLDPFPLSREAFQPPLAYIVPALGYTVATGPGQALIWFRTVNALIGAAAAAAAFLVGRRAFPDSEFAAPLGGLAAVALPSTALVFATANNDALAALLGLCVLGFAATLVREGGTPRAFGALGALVGVTGIVKLSGWLLVVPALTAAVFAPGARARVRRSAAVLGLTAAVAAPWAVRNIAVYGEPTATSAFAQLAPVPGRSIGGFKLLIGTHPSHPRAQRLWPEVGRTSIGVLRWSDLRLHPAAYLVALIATAVAGTLAVRRLAIGPRSEAIAADVRVTAVFATGLIALTAGLIWYAMTVDYQPQGRYLLPALLPSSAFLGTAVRRRGFVAAACVLAVLLVSAIAVTLRTYGWP
jgi:hypothetical protein